MASIKKRVSKLERQSGGPARLLVLRQSLEDPELFSGPGGEEYRKGVNWPEGDNLTIIKVVHDRPGEE